jgi:hypothetical protein
MIMAKMRAITAAVAAAGVGAVLMAAGPAQADPGGTVGVRETVCAQTLYFRTSPGGAFSGTLYTGQTFLVKEVTSGWDYGFAYGDINRDGWVQSGWFC